MSKRVVLVNPGRGAWASTHPPIHLGYIASYLEHHGVEVHILDELVGHDVAESLSRLRPEIVGITATTPMAPDAYRVAKIAKDMGITTVMGGRHATALSEEALNHVDMVVLGEGEKAMLDIVNGRRELLIEGAYTKNLEEIPSPSWHLMDMEFYVKNGPRENHLRMYPPNSRIGALITTRGCPYNCIFCYNSWRDTPVRFHSAERVVSDVQTLVDCYKVNALFFMDDDIVANRKRFRQICRLLIDNGMRIRWGCQASVNSIDRETLELAKEAGCIQVGFGFESGSQRILSLLKKGRTTVEKNAQAVRLCREIGIKSWGTFMVGNPTETTEDVQKTLDFIKNSTPDGIGVHVTTPFPGTELWKWCEERKLIPENIDWSIFTTGQVAIPACDTIPPDKISRLRDEIYYFFYPIRIHDVLKSPVLLWNALKHPWSALRKLKYLRPRN